MKRTRSAALLLTAILCIRCTGCAAAPGSAPDDTAASYETRGCMFSYDPALWTLTDESDTAAGNHTAQFLYCDGSMSFALVTASYDRPDWDSDMARNIGDGWIRSFLEDYPQAPLRTQGFDSLADSYHVYCSVDEEKRISGTDMLVAEQYSVTFIYHAAPEAADTALTDYQAILDSITLSNDTGGLSS